MTNTPALRILFAVSLTSALVACGVAPTTSSGSNEETGDEDGVGTVESGLVLPSRCYGKMLQPTPLEVQQPIGQAMTLRVNRKCDSGAALVDRKIRIYARKYEGGVASAPQLLVDWTDWPASQYRFETSWTAGVPLSSGTMSAGRYQIYSYVLNSSLYSDWANNDTYARQMSTRSDNTYVELVDPGSWSSSAWGACSVSCGGGTQTRTNSCVDASNAPLASRFCLSSAPSTSQACNTSACASNSCVGHCGGFAGLCACDTDCTLFNDCCSDYAAICN